MLFPNLARTLHQKPHLLAFRDMDSIRVFEGGWIPLSLKSRHRHPKGWLYLSSGFMAVLYFKVVPFPISLHLQINLAQDNDLDLFTPRFKNVYWPLKLFEQWSPNTLQIHIDSTIRPQLSFPAVTPIITSWLNSWWNVLSAPLSLHTLNSCVTYHASVTLYFINPLVWDTYLAES